MHMFNYKNFCDRHLDIITLKMRIFYAVTVFLITPLLITLFTNNPYESHRTVEAHQKFVAM